MPKNISTLISTLFKRAGIDPADPKYIDLVNISGQVGEEAYNDAEKALSHLMTLDEARYHTELRKHFRQNALDPIDKELERWLEDNGVAEEDKADIVAERNTYTKLRKALEKTQEIENKKAAARSTAEGKRLSDELAAARRQAEDIKAQYDIRTATLEQEADRHLADYAVHMQLSALDYANDRMTRAEAVAGFRPLLDRALQERGAKYILNKETNELALVDAGTGQPLLDGHTPVSFSDFVSGIAAAKRVLKINDAEAADRADPGSGQKHITYPTHIPAGSGLPRSNQNALQIIESKLKGG